MIPLRPIARALLLACAAGAAPAAAQERPGTIALNIQPPAPGQAALLLDRIRGARVRHIRASWWHWLGPEAWAWYPRYRNAGIEVLPLVYAGEGDPETAGARIAARYRILFDAYGPFPYVQLENEVDGDGPFGIPGRDPYRQGRRWGEQMKIAARLIRRFDPAAKIVTGGVAWSRGGVTDWVRGVVEVGGFDVLAMHVYGIGCAGEPLSRYRAVRAAGWRGPIWVTELGVNHAHARYINRAHEGFQAEQIRLCLAEDPSRNGYQRLYWFQLTPDPEGYGILRPDFSPSPAYEWLRSRGR